MKAVLLGLGLCALLAGSPAGSAETPAVPAIKNAQTPRAGLLTGGQPGRAEFRQLQAAGYRMVINLRPEGEFTEFDEAAEVQALGMDYVHIPVAGGADLGKVKAEALDAALKRAGDAPVLVHCASGNRVGALVALRAHLLEKRTPEQALAAGKAAGLGKLEPRVRVLLGLSADPAVGR